MKLQFEAWVTDVRTVDAWPEALRRGPLLTVGDAERAREESGVFAAVEVAGGFPRFRLRVDEETAVQMLTGNRRLTVTISDEAQP